MPVPPTATSLEHGGWEVPTHAEVMELNIPAIHGVGGSRIYFVDRYREFSIYDVDFMPIPAVERNPPATAGMHFFGIVQYIGADRTYDWTRVLPRAVRHRGDSRRAALRHHAGRQLLRAPALQPANRFMLQLIEPEAGMSLDTSEQLQRIGLGVPDVLAAVRALRALGMEFVETEGAHTERARRDLTKTYLGSVVFELVPQRAADMTDRRSLHQAVS